MKGLPLCKCGAPLQLPRGDANWARCTKCKTYYRTPPGGDTCTGPSSRGCVGAPSVSCGPSLACQRYQTLGSFFPILPPSNLQS